MIQSLHNMLLLVSNLMYFVQRVLISTLNSFFTRYFHSEEDSLGKPLLLQQKDILWPKPQKVVSFSPLNFMVLYLQYSIQYMTYEKNKKTKKSTKINCIGPLHCGHKTINLSEAKETTFCGLDQCISFCCNSKGLSKESSS